MVELDPVLAQMDGRTLVYLFSDGLNTDDLNVIKKAETLTKKYDVCFIIVSMATTPQGKATLEAIRDLTKCSHIIGFDDAVNSPELFLDDLYVKKGCTRGSCRCGKKGYQTAAASRPCGYVLV